MGHIKILIVITLVLTGALVAAQAQNAMASKPLLCSISNITECTPNDGCFKTTVENVGLPHFLKMDVANKTVTPADPIEGKPTPIERVERIDNKLLLQGAEDGFDNVHDGLGWTAAISESTGKFIFTASGEDVAFVAFGACTTR